MTWFNELHVILQVYLSGVIFLIMMFTLITIYGYIRNRMKNPIHVTVVGLTFISLFSWVGLIIVLIVFSVGLNKRFKSIDGKVPEE